MQDFSTEVKKAADAGKCFDTAMKEVKLPKYEKWGNYENGLAANVDYEVYAEHAGTRSDVKTLSGFDSRKQVTITLKVHSK